MLGMSQAVSEAMRSNVPVDTGRLKRSIKVEPLIETPTGLSEPISFLEYGIFTDRGTKFIPAQNWVGRSIDQVINQQMPAVADAAAHDYADTIGKILPNDIDITIDL
jgi:hypothetical protein